jgi:hypothetical protein
MTKALESIIYHADRVAKEAIVISDLIEFWKKPHPVDDKTLPLTDFELATTKRYLAKGGDVPWDSAYVARLVKTIDNLTNSK